MNTKTTM